jgi:hypothetical protein
MDILSYPPFWSLKILHGIRANSFGQSDSPGLILGYVDLDEKNISNFASLFIKSGNSTF